MIAGAAMIAQLPYWILLEALLFLLAGLGVLRLRQGLKHSRNSIASSIVLIMISATAITLLWIRAGTPLWRYVAVCLLLALASLVVILQRGPFRKAAKLAIAPEMDSRFRRRKYIYWSQRKIDATAESLGIRLPGQTELAVHSPPVPTVPTVDWKTNRGPIRHQVANRLLEAISWTPRYDGGQPAPSSKANGFVEGAGTIAFSEFRGSEEFRLGEMAISFTALETSDNIRVAICLFAAWTTLTDSSKTAPGPFRGRWTFSSSPAIGKFIRSYGRDKSYFSDDELAREAVKIALDDRDVGKSETGPWKRRPLTFAEIQEKPSSWPRFTMRFGLIRHRKLTGSQGIPNLIGSSLEPRYGSGRALFAL